MSLVQVSIDRISNKGNPIAEESYEGREIHVPDANEGDTVVVELSDHGSYVVGKTVKEHDGNDVSSMDDATTVNQSREDYSQKSNHETIARCPVKQCSAERFSRGMALHVYNSVGRGHGRHGKIPENIDFDNLETVGSGEVSIDYPLSTENADNNTNIGNSSSINGSRDRVNHHDEDESFMYIEGWDEDRSSVNRQPNLDKEYAELKERFKCPYCEDTYKLKKELVRHLEQDSGVGAHPYDIGRTEIQIPIVHVNIYGEEIEDADYYDTLFGDSKSNINHRRETKTELPLAGSQLVKNLDEKEETDSEENDWQSSIIEMITEEPELSEKDIKTETVERKVHDSKFAELVKQAYDFSCAVCGKNRHGPNGQPEVEAAHIYPKSENGKDDIRNAIALCRLHHWAFDVGWFTISTEHTIEIHGDPTENGFGELLEYNGNQVQKPPIAEAEPHRMFLDANRDLIGGLISET
jgi:hypothetical protein